MKMLNFSDSMITPIISRYHEAIFWEIRWARKANISDMGNPRFLPSITLGLPLLSFSLAWLSSQNDDDYVILIGNQLPNRIDNPSMQIASNTNFMLI